MKQVLLLCLLYGVGQFPLLAQSITLAGKVQNKDNGEAIPAATIRVKGKAIAAVADEAGAFTVTVRALPVTLIVSSVNYEEEEVVVTTGGPLALTLRSAPALSEVVIRGGGDSRIRSNVLNALSSIERVGTVQIRNAPTADYYGLLPYLKGTDVVTSSLTMNTVSTRGFNGSGSTRVNQIVDGMDNQAPGLNFFVGNFAGLTEPDVESMELLPGASSALYGPGGTNGTILINSKSPFKYQGLSLVVKEGLLHVDGRQHARSPYHNFSLRWAKAFKDRFAFKVSAQYISATDWLAGDTSNYAGEGPLGKVVPGTRATDPNYNGVNVYGDEASANINEVAQAMVAGGLLPAAVLPLVPDAAVSRTGYHERDIVDPEAENLKLSGALHYRLTQKIEAQLMGYWGTGSTVYTGNNRYALKNITIGQYKLELKHPAWFLRGYTTQEDAGESYTATLAAVNFNNQWKPHPTWFGQYVGAFVTGKASLGMSDAEAHALARSVADKERPLPGTPEFQRLFEQVRQTPVSKTGAGGLFLEKSQLWMAEGQYDFSHHIKWMDLIVGANLKRYILDSKGTLFIDTAGTIKINEVGVYAQLTKRLFGERLTFSFAGRMDKNEDFKEQFTPRATALVRVARNNNLRFSWQTAYRFPSTQQKYIRLDVGAYTLLGGLTWVVHEMKAEKDPLLDISGDIPVPYQYRGLKPERMRSFEIGYKGYFSRNGKEGLLVDAYGYWGAYKDFLGRNILFQPATGKVFSTVLNSSTQVKTYGYGLGLDYRLPRNYAVFFNGYSDVITDVPSGFQAYFNTPKYRFNAGVGNSGFGKKERWGFNVLFRWQDAFHWEGELANGPVKAYSTVDAQVGYKLPRINSQFRIGGTNIFNHYYKTGYANPEIGGLYYLSYAYNF